MRSERAIEISRQGKSDWDSWKRVKRDSVKESEARKEWMSELNGNIQHIRISPEFYLLLLSANSLSEEKKVAPQKFMS